jgi:hypothetical protein
LAGFIFAGMDPENWIVDSFFFGSDAVCFYCGEPANSRDHVIPHSFLTITDRSFERGIFTKACRDCNVRMGAFMPDSLAAKCERINALLSRNYRSVLEMPEWTRRELRDMKRTLRTAVQLRLSKKAVACRRIFWQRTLDFQELWETAHQKSKIEQPRNWHLHAFMEPPWKKIPLLSPSANAERVLRGISLPRNGLAAETSCVR